jgi:hypothetical protein
LSEEQAQVRSYLVKLGDRDAARGTFKVGQLRGFDSWAQSSQKRTDCTLPLHSRGKE